MPLSLIRGTLPRLACAFAALHCALYVRSAACGGDKKDRTCTHARTHMTHIPESNQADGRALQYSAPTHIHTAPKPRPSNTPSPSSLFPSLSLLPILTGAHITGPPTSDTTRPPIPAST